MAASSKRWWLRGSRANNTASRAINKACKVLLAAPPAKPRSCWPRGWKRSRLAPLSHCSSRLRSQGNLVSKSARWLGTLGISSASCLACCSTSGSSREVSRPPKVTSTTSSIARAAWRFTGRMRRSRVTGTSRATARTIEPKSTSNTQRSSQASSPSTTRARKPIRMRAFMEGLVGVGEESMDQGCPESRLRAG